MHSESFRLQQSDRILLAHRAWTAYLSVSVACFVVMGIVIAILSGASTGLAFAVFLSAAPILLYRILHIRSGELYYDDAGIWFYCGLLPWNKGVVGVKWRDLDEAVFYQNFWSWASNAHTLKLTHRFTRSAEIILSDMQRGDRVASEINYIHQELARRGRLR